MEILRTKFFLCPPKSEKSTGSKSLKIVLDRRNDQLETTAYNGAEGEQMVITPQSFTEDVFLMALFL